MTLFLRDDKNRTISDTEFYIDGDHLEISNSINIENYSRLLLGAVADEDDAKIRFIISGFDFISEIRGWMWESCFGTSMNTKDKYGDVLKKLRTIHRALAEKTGTLLVED
jgi:hypothetical protein